MLPSLNPIFKPLTIPFFDSKKHLFLDDGINPKEKVSFLYVLSSLDIE